MHNFERRSRRARTGFSLVEEEEASERAVWEEEEEILCCCAGRRGEEVRLIEGIEDRHEIGESGISELFSTS